MDRRGVKTMLIILLLVTDLFLLGLWISRQQRTFARQKAMDTELERILAEAGITVSTEQLPVQSAHMLQFLRDARQERAAAEALLGQCQVEEMGGGITEYHSEAGSARFRGLGEFEITLAHPMPLGQPEAELTELAQRMGVVPAEPGDLRLEPVENGYAVWVQSHIYPIWGCYAQFAVAGGRLTGVEGQWLLGDGYHKRDTVSRSAGWTLLSLARSLGTEGLEPSELIGMEMGYRLNAVSPETLRLTPCWRVILTGTGGERIYYVNAVTGVPEP